MGWTYSTAWESQKDVEMHLKNTLSPGYECLGTSSRFGEFYMAVATPRNNNRFINVFLIRGNKTDGWGYKGMSESCEPFYYNCPEKLLKLSTANDCGSIRWRNKCRALRAEKAKKKAILSKVLVGDIIDTTFGKVRFSRFLNKSQTSFAAFSLTKQTTFKYNVKDICITD